MSLSTHISTLIENANSAVTACQVEYLKITSTLFTKGQFIPSESMLLLQAFSPVEAAIKQAQAKFQSDGVGIHLCQMIEDANHAVTQITIAYNNALASLVNTPLFSKISQVSTAFEPLVQAVSAAQSSFHVK